VVPTWLPTDEEMRNLRERFEFVCTCIRPHPVVLDLWGVLQCDRCGKKVMNDDQR
jgi:hypothetical protein